MPHPLTYQVELKDGKVLNLFGSFHVLPMRDLPPFFLEKILKAEILFSESEGFSVNSFIIENGIREKLIERFKDPVYQLSEGDRKNILKYPDHEELFKWFCEMNKLKYEKEFLFSTAAAGILIFLIQRMDREIIEAAKSSSIKVLFMDSVSECKNDPTLAQLLKKEFSEDDQSSGSENGPDKINPVDHISCSYDFVFKKPEKEGLTLGEKYLQGVDLCIADSSLEGASNLFSIESRNVDWVNFLIENIEKTDVKTFSAVCGVAHLKGLVELFSKKGYQVKKLEMTPSFLPSFTRKDAIAELQAGHELKKEEDNDDMDGVRPS